MKKFTSMRKSLNSNRLSPPAISPKNMTSIYASPRLPSRRCNSPRCISPRCISPRCISPRCISPRCVSPRCRSPAHMKSRAGSPPGPRGNSPVSRLSNKCTSPQRYTNSHSKMLSAYEKIRS